MTRIELLDHYRTLTPAELVHLRGGVMRCLTEGCDKLPAVELQVRLGVIEQIKLERPK